jgi:hypothetical protein
MPILTTSMEATEETAVAEAEEDIEIIKEAEEATIMAAAEEVADKATIMANKEQALDMVIEDINKEVNKVTLGVAEAEEAEIMATVNKEETMDIKEVSIMEEANEEAAPIIKAAVAAKIIIKAEEAAPIIIKAVAEVIIKEAIIKEVEETKEVQEDTIHPDKVEAANTGSSMAVDKEGLTRRNIEDVINYEKS